MASLSRTASRLLFTVLVLSLCASGLAAFADLRLQPGPGHEPAHQLDGRVVQPPGWMDRDGDRIDDRLERKYRREGTAGLQDPNGPPAADVMICLDRPPTAADLARYRAMGAMKVEAWSDLVYVLRARFPTAALPPAALEILGRGPGVVWVEENAVGRPMMYRVNRQSRARQVAAAGFEGNPNQTIVVLDTGVSPHPDLSNLVAWQDFAGVSALVDGDEYPTPTDRNNHGTGVAGMAVGTGAAAGITQGVGPLPISFATPLRIFATDTIVNFPADTRAATTPSSLTARLRWQAPRPGLTHNVQLAGAGLLLGNGSTPATGPQPFVLSVNNVPPGVSAFDFEAAVGTSTDQDEIPDVLAWLQVATPMSAVGDGRRLMQGVAPRCRLAAVKVVDDSGLLTFTAFINAVTWVNANRRSLNIVCVNCSLGFRSVSVLLDTLVTQLTRNGVVWVNAAGNERELERQLEAAGDPSGVFSPASAPPVIAVGATNNLDQLAGYSNYGREGQQKPDLLAPSGSLFTGVGVIVPDSNTSDPDGLTSQTVADQFPDDYRSGVGGTSMASPQVAGAVMLLIEALGSWNFTEAEVLLVKMVLLMTASETNARAERVQVDPLGQVLPLPPEPQLNRGAKDRAEGYGRINADAAVEALTRTLTLGAADSATLGPGVFDKKVWARNVMLSGGTTYTFTLNNPAGADLDLYIYSNTPATVGDSNGEPQIVMRSTSARLGGVEVVQYTPPSSGRFFVVVKFVAGRAGAFQFSAVNAADFALSATPATQVLETKGESVTYDIAATPINNFTTAINLTVSSTLPAGTTATFNPTSVNPGSVSKLTITTSATTPAETLSFTIQGTAGGLTRTIEVILVAGRSWWRFHNDSRGTGRSPFDGPATSRRPWFQDEFTAPIFSSAAFGGDGTIYYGARDASMNALDPATGQFRWFYLPTSAAVIDSTPAIGLDDTIYFGDDAGWFYALRPDGTEKWIFRLGTAPVRSGPVIGRDGTIYVTAGGTLHALTPDGTRKWMFSSGGNVNSSPTLGPDDTIYFGTGSATGTAANRLFAIRDNGATFQVKWQFEALGNVVSSPLVANGSIYFGSNGDNAGGRFYVLTDGGTMANKVAEFTTGGAVQSSPAVGMDGTVYVGCNDNNLYAFTAQGALKWRYATSGQVISSPAVGANGIIFFGSRDARIFAVRDNGNAAEVVWSVTTGGEVQASPAIGRNGLLCVGSFDGAVWAFQDNATPDFEVSITPGAQVGVVSGTLNYTVLLRTRNNFQGPVSFAVVGTLPNGVSATFQPAQINLGASGTGRTTLRFTTTTDTPAGEFLFRVRATSGNTSHESINVASMVLVDYALYGQPTTRRVTAGDPATFSVAVIANPTQVDLRGTINLSAAIVSGPPGGTAPTIAFDPTSVALPGLATINVTTSTATTPGTYEIDVIGTIGTVQRRTRLRLEVAGFNVTPTPPTQRVTAGGNALFTVNAESVHGFSGNVVFSASPAIAGVTYAFNPANVGAPGSSTLTVATTTATQPGTYQVTITGTSGAIVRSTIVTLEVAGFNISATPATQRVTAGGSTDFKVDLTAVLGFNNAVNLSASPAIPGVTYTFNPTSVTGTGSSTLTVATSGNTPPGAHAITIVGTSGGIARAVMVTLEVAGFTVAANPTTSTVTAGNSANVTVTVTSVFGFNQAVVLAPSGTLPAGVTMTFNPTSVTGSGNSTLTIGTSAATPVGTHTLSFTGSAGGITVTVNVMLTVNSAT